MGRKFFHKTIQVFLLLVLLSLKLSAGGKGNEPAAKSPITSNSQFSGAIDRCGEIELTGTHAFTGYSQQTGKKTTLQFWQVSNEIFPLSHNRNTTARYQQNARRSVHLAYIFPFHYFW